MEQYLSAFAGIHYLLVDTQKIYNNVSTILMKK